MIKFRHRQRHGVPRSDVPRLYPVRAGRAAHPGARSVRRRGKQTAHLLSGAAESAHRHAVRHRVQRSGISAGRRAVQFTVPQRRSGALAAAVRSADSHALLRRHHRRHDQRSGAAESMRPLQHHHQFHGCVFPVFFAAEIRNGRLLFQFFYHPSGEFYSQPAKASHHHRGDDQARRGSHRRGHQSPGQRQTDGRRGFSRRCPSRPLLPPDGVPPVLLPRCFGRGHILSYWGV